MENNDSWDNWFSPLDMDGDDDHDHDGSFYHGQTDSSVNIEEFHGDILRHLAMSSETQTEIHSLHPSSYIVQSNSAATVIGAATPAAVSSLSFEEKGFNGGQSSDSWNIAHADAVPAGVSEDSPKQDYPCLKGKANCEQLGRSSKRTQEDQNFEPRESQGSKKGRRSSEAQYHIMSERKRRQEMAERFIALSAIIPGLKKIDKASVLREAINYVKQLQERVAVLEKENKKKRTMSMNFINKSHLCSASREKCPDDYCRSSGVLPEVEAIGLDKEVLIRIHCEKRKGIKLKILPLLENIHLSTASSSILPFGNSALSITIIAKMGEAYNMTVNDLVKNLRQDLLKLNGMQLDPC